MARIGILYKIEELIQDKPAEERYQERQKQALPVVDAFFEWLHSMEGSVDRSSLIHFICVESGNLSAPLSGGWASEY